MALPMGNDPYDALRSPLIPRFVREHARLRQAVIQARRRLPIDLAPILRIEPFVMSKAVGCQLSSTSRQFAAGEMGAEDYADRAGECGDFLLANRMSSDEPVWGYEFDVQTRWAHYPVGTPNVIATVFVVRGLLESHAVRPDATFVRAAQEAVSWVTARLMRQRGSSRYIAYLPSSDVLVHNANLLASGILALSGRILGDERHMLNATECALTSVQAQREDGSWPYGEGSGLTWADNFHTAYNLDGLLQVWLATDDPRIRRSLELGVHHWVRDFFEADGAPKYYPDRPSPYDIHSAATAVDVGFRLASWGLCEPELAGRVAGWTRANLLDSQGWTYYRKSGRRVDRRNFVRWGDAHWGLALGSEALDGRPVPLEACVHRGTHE